MPHEDDPVDARRDPYEQVVDLMIWQSHGALHPGILDDWPVNDTYRRACTFIKREEAMIKAFGMMPRLF